MPYNQQELDKLDTITPAQALRLCRYLLTQDQFNEKLPTFHGDGRVKTSLTLGELVDAALSDA